MRVLIDAQLPPALARGLPTRGHEASHLLDHGLLEAADTRIRMEAERLGAVIVSKDDDFVHLRTLSAEGPSAVWVGWATPPVASCWPGSPGSCLRPRAPCSAVSDCSRSLKTNAVRALREPLASRHQPFDHSFLAERLRGARRYDRYVCRTSGTHHGIRGSSIRSPRALNASRSARCDA